MGLEQFHPCGVQSQVLSMNFTVLFKTIDVEFCPKICFSFLTLLTLMHLHKHSKNFTVLSRQFLDKNLVALTWHQAIWTCFQNWRSFWEENSSQKIKISKKQWHPGSDLWHWKTIKSTLKNWLCYSNCYNSNGNTMKKRERYWKLAKKVLCWRFLFLHSYYQSFFIF